MAIDHLALAERRARQLEAMSPVAAARRAKVAREAERRAGITAPVFVHDSTRLAASVTAVEPTGEREYSLAAQGVGAAPDGGFGGSLAGRGDKADDADDRDLIARCFVAYRCLQLLADGIMSLPPRPTRGRGDFRQAVTGGRLVDLLDRVNDHWDFPTLMAITVWTMITSRRGAFWVMDAFDEVTGKPGEIWWASPDQMSVVPGAAVKLKRGEEQAPEDRYISHFHYDDGSKKGVRLERRQVVWFRVPDPSNEFGNLTPFAAMAEPARLAMFALSANALIFQNGLTGAGIVTPEDVGQPFTLDQGVEIQGLLREVLKGRGNFHKVLVLNKSVKFTPLNYSPRDAQFVELLSLSVSQICIAAGVPKPLVEPTEATFANTDGARGILWTNTLIPLATRLAATIREQLIAVHFADEADGFEFDLSAVPELQEGVTARLERDQMRLGMLSNIAGQLAGGVVNYEGAIIIAHTFAGLSLDDARAMLPAPVAGQSEAKVPTGIQTQLAMTALMNYNMQQLTAAQAQWLLVHFLGTDPETAAQPFAMPRPGVQAPALPPPATAPMLPPPVGRTVRRRGQGPIIIEGRARMVVEAEPQAKTGGVLPASHPWAYGGERHRAYMRKAGEFEGAFEADVRDAMTRLLGVQADQLTKALAKLSERDIADIMDAADTAEDAARALATKVFPRARFVGNASSAYAAALEPLAGAAARQALADLGVSGIERLLTMAAPDIGAALLLRGQTFAQLTADTGWSDLAGIIARSLAETGGDITALVGDIRSVGSLAYVVSGYLADINVARAEMIARTEVHGAAQSIGLVTVKASGVGAAKRWLTAEDGLVRSGHEEIHGQTVGIDADFESGECGSAAAPGMFGDAGCDINCRCECVYLTESDLADEGIDLGAIE